MFLLKCHCQGHVIDAVVDTVVVIDAAIEAVAAALGYRVGRLA